MGFYKHILPCGCIEITTTLTIPPSTYIQTKCREHSPLNSVDSNEKNKFTVPTKSN